MHWTIYTRLCKVIFYNQPSICPFSVEAVLEWICTCMYTYIYIHINTSVCFDEREGERKERRKERRKLEMQTLRGADDTSREIDIFPSAVARASFSFNFYLSLWLVRPDADLSRRFWRKWNFRLGFLSSLLLRNGVVITTGNLIMPIERRTGVYILGRDISNTCPVKYSWARMWKSFRFWCSVLQLFAFQI